MAQGQEVTTWNLRVIPPTRSTDTPEYDDMYAARPLVEVIRANIAPIL